LTGKGMLDGPRVGWYDSNAADTADKAMARD